MKSKLLVEPHLTLKEMRLPSHGEWTPRLKGWCVLQFTSGIGYFWQEASAVREIAAESVLIISAEAGGSFRASQLGPMLIHYFWVDPERLGGLLTMSEQLALKKAAGRQSLRVRMLLPGSPVSRRFANLCAGPRGGDLSQRLQMLDLFFGLFDCDMKAEALEPQSEIEGRERLKQLLQEMAADELMELSLSDLAPRVRCSARHLSRLFREEVGASFREKQNEIRLAKACDLLANSKAKLVDVALTSGFNSTSPFSILFKKHFGVSPGQWREQHGSKAREREKFDGLLWV